MKTTFRSTLRSGYRLGIKLVACCVLTPVIFVFLLRRRKLFDAPLIMPLYIGSFGNTFMALDFAARLYAGSSISLVMVRDPDQNFYLPAMFKQSMTIYWLGTLGFAPYTVVAVLRTLMYMFCPFIGRSAVIEWQSIYHSLARMPERITGSEEQDCLLAVPYDRTGFIYLLEHDIGPKPSLPPDLVQRCHSFITAQYPNFFARPFITLLLRAKGHDAPELSARCRSSGPMENYRAAVAHATARGYHVVGTGETIACAFSDIPGFFDLGEMPDAPGLINIFLLSQCALYWGQHSGPVAVANSCGIPCLITDGLPYCSGTFGGGGKDIVLYKPLTLDNSATSLNMVELYERHPDLAYGYGFARKAVTIGCNSPEDITKALSEALDRLASPAPSDLAGLAEQLRRLMQPGMIARFQSSRPPEFILRQLPLDLA